jgi:uncharacterized membrane protein YraQ (UPF0718 family)
MEHFIRISDFILKSFLHIWPYLLVTIPLAVLINMTGASRFINRAYSKNIIISVLLATAVGAFSPLCSCGVIPVISSLLIGGVPIAPVMSFWIASPSMDPEIFFLSSSVSGWDLALWRLVSTLIISLFSGFMTYYITSLGFINAYGIKIKKQVSGDRCECTSECSETNQPFRRRLLSEILKSTWMVAKFMGFAFLINALIKFYLPENMIKGLLSGNGTEQVLLILSLQ